MRRTSTSPRPVRNGPTRRPGAGALLAVGLLLLAGSVPLVRGAVPAEAARPTFTVTSAPPADAVWSAPYSHTFAGDAPGATWSVTSGTLPTGLTLDPATGELSGTTTEIGDHAATVQATWTVPIGSLPPFTAIAAGGYNSCGLYETGEAVCWGSDLFGQTTVPAGPFSDLAVGHGHICASTPAAAIDCWGGNYSGQATDQSGPLTSLTAGSTHTCAIDSTSDVQCWGHNAVSMTGPFVTVSTGGDTCALAADGSATCRFPFDPVEYEYPGPFTTITVGASHTCALTTATGAADCWGSDTYGQATDQTGPYTDIDAGTNHTCGLTATGAADCWGDNTYGQATDQTGPFTDIDVGNYHSCGLLVDGPVFCWGSSFYGESTPPNEVHTAEQAFTLTVVAPTITSPDPTTAVWETPYTHTFAASAPAATWTVSDGSLPAGLTLDTTTGELSGTPTTPAAARRIVVRASWPAIDPAIVTEQTFTLAALATPAVTSAAPADALWLEPYAHAFTAIPSGGTWSVTAGNLPAGLGLDSVTGELAGVPTAPGPSGSITVEAESAGQLLAVATGQEHSCGLEADGAVSCWGLDTDGQATDQPGPFTTITAGDWHTCGIAAADGSVGCWGRNDRGQSAPQVGPYLAVAAGDSHTCGILAADGAVDCWGRNDEGQATDQVGPYRAVTAGQHHTCATLISDGSIDCWGANAYGQSTDQTGPYGSIAAGWVHTCGVRSDLGTVECWGENGSGQLGDGTYSASTSPVAAVGVTGAVEVTAGSFGTCALLSDATVTCWGSNTWNQISDAPDSYIPTPTPIAGITGAVAVSSRDVHVCATLAGGTIDCWGRNVNGQTDAPAPAPLTATQVVDVTVRADPSLTTIDDQSVTQDTSTGPLTFHVWDEDHLSTSLAVTAGSSDQTLLPDANLVVAGTASTRTLTATPAAGQTGSATITVTVTDPDGLTAQTSFVLTVTPQSASISGTVTTGSGPIGGVIVGAYENSDGYTPSGYAITAPDGTYTITGLDPGTYRIVAVPLSNTTLRLTWQLDSTPTGTPDRTTATDHTITAPTDALGAVDLQLAVAARFTGTVTSPTGPVEGTTVRAFTPGAPAATAITTTAPDGTYTLGGLDTGTYQLLFTPPAGTPLRTEWHDDTTTRANATDLAITVDTTTTVDAHLDGNNAITGTVTTTGNPLPGATVAAFAPGSFIPTRTTTTTADGTYQLTALPAGTYTIRFTAPALTTQWFDGVPTRSLATAIVVTDGSLTTGIDAAMTP